MDDPVVERTRFASGVQWDLYRFRTGQLSEADERRVRDLITAWREAMREGLEKQ